MPSSVQSSVPESWPEPSVLRVWPRRQAESSAHRDNARAPVTRLFPPALCQWVAGCSWPAAESPAVVGWASESIGSSWVVTGWWPQLLRPTAHHANGRVRATRLFRAALVPAAAYLHRHSESRDGLGSGSLSGPEPASVGTSDGSEWPAMAQSLHASLPPPPRRRLRLPAR